MVISVGKWVRKYYNKMMSSIAFYPAIIALGFLLLSLLMLNLDFSPWGKELKGSLKWLSLKDASTARSIISTVAGAVISLTVFSFSMVMIVLNQAASQMSNRVLGSMIQNRFQQMILGFYIGTIVYALFLLTTIRDIDTGVSVPALSIYLLILFTVIDIFLFIYFLDYVTQTVKYETVIDRVEQQTMQTMKKKFVTGFDEAVDWTKLNSVQIQSEESSYYQGFSEKKLMKLACEKNWHVSILCNVSTYLLEGSVFMIVYSKEAINDDCRQEILAAVDFFKGQPIGRNADYGFQQLAEVAIKALSPGINDPATAVISLHALTNLLAYRLNHHLPAVIKDADDTPRIFVQSSSFEDLFEKCIHPIRIYGEKDQYIQNELIVMMNQLKMADHQRQYTEAFDKFINKINNQRKEAIIS